MNYEEKIVELQADIHAVWKLQCQNLYNSKNLAVLAIRESVQNSLDSVRQAIKNKICKHGEISIGFEDNTMWVEDNGMGMDIPTIHNKFLTLGGTSKNDKDNVGGFGLAKSVILGCGSGFKVETQDNVFTSEDIGKNPIQKQAYRQGTKITVYNPQLGNGKPLIDCYWEFYFQVEDMIMSCDPSIFKDITIKINNEIKDFLFKPTEKSKRLPAELNISTQMIPEDTELSLNVYKMESSAQFIYVRLKGLTQYKTYLSWNSTFSIVLDINTKLNPRDTRYPFSTNREGLKSQYQGIIEAIRNKVSQAPLSIAKDSKYKEILYDNATDNSKPETIEMSKIITSNQVSNTVANVVKVVKNIKSRGGFTPQGGYVPATIVDYVSQYNSEIEKVAKENNISKSEVIRRADTLFKINNPLSYSWAIYEDKNYDHPKISKNKLVALTIIWDTIIKLMASNYSKNDEFEEIFYPGIILENDVRGMCLEKTIIKNNISERRYFIMVNPFYIPQGDVNTIALYLMGVAAHELAHFVCGSFEAHGETFSYTREEIMNTNLDEWSNIVTIINKAKIQNLIKLSTNKADNADNADNADRADKDDKADKDDNEQLSYYKDCTIQELIDRAEFFGVDTEELANKYPNKKIFRMRLAMKLKKLELGDDD